MAARLGNVIWWTCLVVGLLSALLGLIVLVNPGTGAGVWLPRYFGFAVVSIVFGRAARYVLAGR